MKKKDTNLLLIVGGVALAGAAAYLLLGQPAEAAADTDSGPLTWQQKATLALKNGLLPDFGVNASPYFGLGGTAPTKTTFDAGALGYYTGATTPTKTTFDSGAAGYYGTGTGSGSGYTGLQGIVAGDNAWTKAGSSDTGSAVAAGTGFGVKIGTGYGSNP